MAESSLPTSQSNEEATSDFDRIWWWRKWLPTRKGEHSRIIARGTMNAALVEFPDGTRIVTSRYAVRRIATAVDVSLSNLPKVE